MVYNIQYEIIETKISINVNLKNETVWLSLMSLALLFNRDKSVISRHIRNIFKEKELKRASTVAIFATVQKEGEREIKRNVNHYNLDVIISVGYRVKSQQGTKFRIWATKLVRNEIIKRTTKKAIGETSEEKYVKLVKMIDMATTNSNSEYLSSKEGKDILDVLHDYTHALDTLEKYDHQKLKIEKTEKKLIKKLQYKEAIQLIDQLRVVQKASKLFGNEKDDSFSSSLETIYQTFDGKDLYPSIEEKAANLLYYIVKNHSFSDGNKRIAAGLFIYFLYINEHLFDENEEKKIANNTLVAITIMIAESKSSEKDMMIKLVVNLIKKK